MFRSALVGRILEKVSLDIQQLSKGVEHNDVPLLTILQVPPLARIRKGGGLCVYNIAIFRHGIIVAGAAPGR